MYRKGVSALIINPDQEFLLVNLNGFEEKYFAVPGGGVEEGESLEDAVYREIKEELDLDKELIGYVGKSDLSLITTFKEPKKQYIGSERYFFGFRFIGNDNDIKLQPEEVRMYKWVPINDLGMYLLFDKQLADTVEKIREIFKLPTE